VFFCTAVNMLSVETWHRYSTGPNPRLRAWRCRNGPDTSKGR
jgi:hypothetical protein